MDKRAKRFKASKFRKKDDLYSTREELIKLFWEDANKIIIKSGLKDLNYFDGSAGDGRLLKDIPKNKKLLLDLTEDVLKGVAHNDFYRTRNLNLKFNVAVQNPPFKNSDLYIKKTMDLLKDRESILFFLLPLNHLQGIRRCKVLKIFSGDFELKQLLIYNRYVSFHENYRERLGQAVGWQVFANFEMEKSIRFLDIINEEKIGVSLFDV